MAKSLQELAAEKGYTEEQPAQEVQEVTPKPQKTADKGGADTIKKNIPVVAFTMDFLRNPEDAFFKWNQTENGRYEKWAGRHFAQLVQIASKVTGADPEQIADKDRRTPEQQEALLKIAAAEQMKRFDRFFDSAYMQALKLLHPLHGEYNDRADSDVYTEGATPDPDSEFYTIKEQAVLYFFAKHEEIKATDTDPLTDRQQEEIIDIFRKLDAFYQDRTGGADYPDTPAILYAFIEQENPAPNEAEAIAAKMPLLQAINPTTHTMPNNALMNTLQQQAAINAGAFDMVVSNARGRRKEITAYTMITFDPGETSIKITDAKLSEYERQVSDAIVSLWIEAIKEEIPPIIYPEMIYRAMPGGGDKASPQQKGAITKAIEKFRHLHIYVDATEEMRKRGVIGENETMRFDDFYLTARHVEKGKTKNGRRTIDHAYYLTAEPIILTYCKLTNQLLTVPAEYIAIEKVQNFKGKNIATGELLPMTATRQAMTGYLLRRIAVMKRDAKEAKERKRSYDRRRAKDKSLEEKPLAAFREQSPVILFDTLFADAGLDGQTKQSAANNRDFVFQVLDYWELCGNIKGYEKQTKGRSITGIQILF